MSEDWTKLKCPAMKLVDGERIERGSPGTHDGLKTSRMVQVVRLLQIVRKWRAQSRRPERKRTPLLACSITVIPKCGAGHFQASEDEEEGEEIMDGSASSYKQPTTPRGYLAMYVGAERRRFLVKADLLNHPLFGIVLEKAKEEFGFQQKGPLNIPCEIAFFEHILWLVESNDPSWRNADTDPVLHFSSIAAKTSSSFSASPGA